MKKKKLNSIELLEFQQNRYPYLYIDYVAEVIPGKSAKGHKNFTNNEWFFPVHFVGAPNVPGAIQMEALAQMLTVAITTQDGLKGGVTHALSHTVRYRKEVLPGDKFVIETEVLSWKRGICKGKGYGITNGEIACEAENSRMLSEFTAANIDAQQKLVNQHGVKINNFPKDVFKLMMQLSSDVVAETADEGRINKEIYESWSTFKKNARLRSPYAEQGYVNLST